MLSRRSEVNSHGHPSHPTKYSNTGGTHHSFAKLQPPRLFALIIGINEYESPKIPNLMGAVPDADAVVHYLQKHLRVPSSHIRNLRNGGATRTAIIGGIKAFSLNEEINEGDPILIYYAGHGGSADTPTGWEIGSTRKIEFLVSYDYSPLDDGNLKHGIPDRTLGALLSQLAMKKGDNITVILDCCHSCSGTRHVGSLDPTAPTPNLNPRGVPGHLREFPPNFDKDIWGVVESSKAPPTERGTKVHPSFARSGLRSHVLLAACGSQELAYEQTSTGRGVFTVALLKTLIDIGINKLTYATLFDRMPPLSSGQKPQCEGFFRQRFIFNGKVISSKRTAIEGKTDVMPDLDADEATGITFTVGVEFEIFDRDPDLVDSDDAQLDMDVDLEEEAGGPVNAPDRPDLPQVEEEMPVAVESEDDEDLEGDDPRLDLEPDSEMAAESENMPAWDGSEMAAESEKDEDFRGDLRMDLDENAGEVVVNDEEASDSDDDAWLCQCFTC